MVEGPAAVHEVDWFAGVFVAEEAGVDDVDVGVTSLGELGGEPRHHQWRDVDRDDRPAHRGDGQGELTCPRSEVDDRRTCVETEVDEPLDLGDGLGVFLVVVAGDVIGIQVLPSRVRDLVDAPLHPSDRVIRATHGQSLPSVRRPLSQPPRVEVGNRRGRGERRLVP